MHLKEKQQYAIFIGIAIILSVLAGGAAGFIAAQSATNSQSFLSSVKNLISDQKVAATTNSDGIVGVVDKASPAVISIIVTKDLPKIDQNVPDLFRQFFGQDFGTPSPDTNNTGGTQQQTIGGGSGFIVSSDGYIVTNKHVVADETADYTVLLNKGDKYTAKVLARDPLNDLAILKIDAKNLPTLSFGNSDTLKPGQSVIAIGNALGEFRNTVSTGVISGLARSITAQSDAFNTEQLVGLIQTDASINPGNSGGPLLDTEGRVIGINVAIAQNAQNVGFALPINQVKDTIESVQKNGKLITAWLGVRYIVVTPEIAKANNLKEDYGALVLRGQSAAEVAVVPGSPADKSGIVENDIILQIDGQQITQDNPLSLVIAKHKPGDILHLKISHQGREKDTTVVLEESKQ